MNTEKYLEGIEQKLSRYFDIEKAYKYKNIDFEMFAKSFVRNERYFASKKFTIYAYESNENIFIKCISRLDEATLLQIKDHLKSATEDYVKPHSEHMSTIITGIVVVENGIEEHLKKMIQKYNYLRSFAFGFKGWVYIRLIVVDLKKGEVLTNRRGKEVKKFYEIS
ncbi:hypothetical protein SAMN05660297_01472 [Natronincola peptidivorans]|uniref:DUF8052 domain-containing protein n=1 Tax=Natronincola peptidivorans TaxID=426128 RepID=A0A1I0BY08_9FIRM|nr:hypothetical protein [Natronincola peptidivorans]SET11925.1 hypothetical protein SAMN05660297_01472 [Natronincola peptidivorans]